MRKKFVVLSLLFLSLFSGCTVLSFYPLYTPDVLIKDTRIEGTWQSVFKEKSADVLKNATIWEITKAKPNVLRSDEEVNYTYILRFYPKGEPENAARFQLHLVKLGGKFFLDFYPEEFECDNDLIFTNVLPVHTFAKLEFKGAKLDVQWFNVDWLQKLFAQNRIRMRHERTDEYTLLTAKPRELQQFVRKYADDPMAFKDGIHVELSKLP